ncbi:hypothetical protein SynPROSU1_02961 [Synechococcus sp. PROS-U-1]|nr:hypothetical protein SynPROSU1_02961 [Synechococcus sp. PROS-U-1]
MLKDMVMKCLLSGPLHELTSPSAQSSLLELIPVSQVCDPDHSPAAGLI